MESRGYSNVVKYKFDAEVEQEIGLLSPSNLHIVEMLALKKMTEHRSGRVDGGSIPN